MLKLIIVYNLIHFLPVSIFNMFFVFVFHICISCSIIQDKRGTLINKYVDQHFINVASSHCSLLRNISCSGRMPQCPQTKQKHKYKLLKKRVRCSTVLSTVENVQSYLLFLMEYLQGMDTCNIRFRYIEYHGTWKRFRNRHQG